MKPFLKTAEVPYRIALGNDATAKQYGIGGMPDSVLIDRQGRIAATYAGLVDKENVEANIPCSPSHSLWRGLLRASVGGGGRPRSPKTA